MVDEGGESVVSPHESRTGGTVEASMSRWNFEVRRPPRKSRRCRQVVKTKEGQYGQGGEVGWKRGRVSPTEVLQGIHRLIKCDEYRKGLTRGDDVNDSFIV